VAPFGRFLIWKKKNKKKEKKNTKFSHLVINYPVKLFTAIMQFPETAGSVWF
jgi:hypothetical protein